MPLISGTSEQDLKDRLTFTQNELDKSKIREQFSKSHAEHAVTIATANPPL